MSICLHSHASLSSRSYGRMYALVVVAVVVVVVVVIDDVAVAVIIIIRLCAETHNCHSCTYFLFVLSRFIFIFLVLFFFLLFVQIFHEAMSRCLVGRSFFIFCCCCWFSFFVPHFIVFRLCLVWFSHFILWLLVFWLFFFVMFVFLGTPRQRWFHFFSSHSLFFWASICVRAHRGVERRSTAVYCFQSLRLRKYRI